MGSATELSTETQQLLRDLAWKSITEPDQKHTLPINNGEASRTGASFITLKKGGHLRGCMGTILAERPLAEDIQINAKNAAFRDPRFSPVNPDELPELTISISVLSSMERMDVRDESELISSIRPEVDGLFLTQGQKRATFLPSVWEQLRDPEVFVARLKEKAGIQGELQNFEAYRYTAEYF